MNIRQEINISAFISRYFHLDLIHNLEDSTFCLNPPIAHVTRSIGTCDWQVCFLLPWCVLLHWLFKQKIALIRLVRLHAALQESAAAWQKQCILVRTFVRLWSALQPPYDHVSSKYRESKTRPAAKVRRCSCSKSAARSCMTTHFILIGQILWWRAWRVLRAYSNNSIPIMLTNLCFYNSKSFFSVVALLSWVIFIKTLIKA